MIFSSLHGCWAWRCSTCGCSLYLFDTCYRRRYRLCCSYNGLPPQSVAHLGGGTPLPPSQRSLFPSQSRQLISSSPRAIGAMSPRFHRLPLSGGLPATGVCSITWRRRGRIHLVRRTGARRVRGMKLLSRPTHGRKVRRGDFTLRCAAVLCCRVRFRYEPSQLKGAHASIPTYLRPVPRWYGSHSGSRQVLLRF